MKFRTLFILIRVVAPASFALQVLGFLIPQEPVSTILTVTGGVPFVAVCIFGAIKGLEIQRKQFLTMSCPFCERDGLVGCGVGGGVGWWLRCETCGIVMPKGLLGLSFNQQTVEEYESDGEEDDDEDDDD